MLRAFVDESGITPHGERTPEHFVLSAVIFDDSDAEKAEAMRDHLCRYSSASGQRTSLHFKDIANHGARRYMTQVIGSRPWLTVISVIVCKRHLEEGEERLIQDTAAQYNYTFRFLLERLSWFAAAERKTLTYVAGELGTAPPERLADHEDALRNLGSRTEIKWAHLSSPAGRMASVGDEPLLQLADVAASATAKAFEPDDWGYTERAYLQNLGPAMYRRRGTLMSYGVKVHPRGSQRRAAYSWAATLPETAVQPVLRLPY